MGLTKGIKLENAFQFVAECKGLRAVDDILATMSPADARTLRRIEPTSWYDTRIHSVITRTVCRAYGGHGFARELGRFEARRELGRSLQWLFRIVPAPIAVRNLQVFWRRGQDTGNWHVDIQSGQISAVLAGWAGREAFLCSRVAGYLEYVLQFLGFDVEQVVHPECEHRGNLKCHFQAFWKQHDARRCKPYSISKWEFPMLVQELATHSDRELVEVAILHFLHDAFGFDRIALWEQTGADLRLMRSLGQAEDQQSQWYVLQTAGCNVGRIEVTARSIQMENIPRELDDWLPGLAIALHHVWSKPVPRSFGKERATQQQTILLADAHGLTKRQADVLERIAEGQTNKEIAADLGCSESAIEQHVRMLLRIFGASNRATLLLRFWSHR